MVNISEIKRKIGEIVVPGVMRSIEDMKLLKEVEDMSDEIKVIFSTSIIPDPVQRWIEDRVRNALKELRVIKEVRMEFRDKTPKELNEIKHIIAVMSGKGGVGKSLVSSLIAIALRRYGYSVGILDADITGPSIPKMFGIKERPIAGKAGILPVASKTGIELMSINLLLPSEDDAIIWRGPLIGKAIIQFGEEVLWGKLDYLVIDLPPGTSDAPLTVLQQFPIDGVIIVFTPQDLVELIVKKAVNMTRKLNKKIIGLIENMSYLYIPELDKKIELFGNSRAEEMAEVASAPLIGVLPFETEIVKLCDRGEIELYEGDFMESLRVFIAKNIQNI